MSDSPAGKGDKPRPVSIPRYRKNYDQIRWHSKRDDKHKGKQDSDTVSKRRKQGRL